MTSIRTVALLRGINVGRAKRIAMADLRALLCELGFTDVRTLLNSGNAVFDSPAPQIAGAAATIEEALVLKLGVAARVTIFTAAELEQVMAANPLLPLATDHARLLVFFLADPPAAKLVEPLLKQDWTPGALALGRRAAYAWCPTGVLDSPVVAALGKHLGDASTSRNWNTLCKLQALCRAAASEDNR